MLELYSIEDFYILCQSRYKSRQYYESKVLYSDLNSANFQNSKFIAKLSTDVATSALLNKIVIEVNYRGVLLK